MNTKFISLSIVAAGLLFGSVSETFADVKTYAGIQCVQSHSGDNRFLPTNFIAGGLFNFHSRRTLVLNCPLVHDQNNIRRAGVRVIDLNPNDRVCARLNAVRRIGNPGLLVKSGPFRCTSNSTSINMIKQLDLGRILRLDFNTHYFISVMLPPKARARVRGGGTSGIVNYFDNEFGAN